ncbi:amino acid ABC transporter permease [Streptomyces sp. NPDC004227]
MSNTFEQAESTEDGSAAAAGDVPIVPRRHPYRWLAAAVTLWLAFSFAQAIATKETMHWDTVGQYVFHPDILAGLVVTLKLTAVATVLGVVGGIVLAIMRLSPNPVLSGVSTGYVWFFRGTPLLVQLLFFYFMAALFPTLSISIPYGPTLFSVSTNIVMTQFVAAVLAFGSNEAAYMAEIVRSGIMSVSIGQNEAAASLGISRRRTLWHIVLPQAMRIIIPPMANNVILLLKATSLVLVIAVPDLLTSVQLIYSTNFLQIPLLTVACAWYLSITSVLTVVQYYLERRFGRGSGYGSSKRNRTRQRWLVGFRGQPAERSLALTN